MRLIVTLYAHCLSCLNICQTENHVRSVEGCVLKWRLCENSYQNEQNQANSALIPVLRSPFQLEQESCIITQASNFKRCRFINAYQNRYLKWNVFQLTANRRMWVKQFLFYCLMFWSIPHCLRRRYAASRLLGLRVRIPPGACMSVSCECCVLSDREASATCRSLI